MLKHHDNRTLNEKIRHLCNEHETYPVKGLEGTRHSIPYVGWYWKYIDFPCMIFAEYKGHIALCAENTDNYKEYIPKKELADKIVSLLEETVQNPCLENFQALFDLIQTVKEE